MFFNRIVVSGHARNPGVLIYIIIVTGDIYIHIKEENMSIKGSWITYEDQTGYFAYPEHASEPLPAIIVIQEIGGVNAHIEDVTRRFAAAGYAALAPDLFAAGGKRPEYFTQQRLDKALAFIRQLPPNVWRDPADRDVHLARIPDPDQSEIAETCDQMIDAVNKLSKFVPALQKAVRHLRTDELITRNQKVACVGFCMGGGLSALLACEEPDLSGAAVFYGMTPPEEKIPAISCPVIGFYGGNDQRINVGISPFEEKLRSTGKTYENYIYDGANHSFFNDDGKSYNVRAVRDSFVRLLTFFYKTLSD